MIYIVEDDDNIRELESYALKNSGFEVLCFARSKEFFEACDRQLPRLVILDIMLPDEDGLSVLAQLRRHERMKDIPVIMVTAKGAEIDKVKGLDAGADDYITKPFGVMELISRVKALLRRTAPHDQPKLLRYQEIAIDESKHLATVNGQSVELTFKEYELLKYLIANQGLVLTRDQIMERVWGFEYAGESRTLDMHIMTLRQKLGESGRAIKTVRNVGYKIGD